MTGEFGLDGITRRTRMRGRKRFPVEADELSLGGLA